MSITNQDLRHFTLLAVLLMTFASCQDKAKQENAAETTEISWEGEIEAEDEILGLGEQWVGDLDGMIERGRIRALVPYNRTSYFINGTKRGGLTFEALTLFEKKLNEHLGKKPGSPGYVQVIFIPMTRDQILPALQAGYGDLAAANLVITEDRKGEFDFSIPALSNWTEVFVSGPGGKSVNSVEDLLGDTVYIRRSSSYYEHLQTFNDSLKSAGKPIIHVQTVEEHLEDDEILEMVNAGILSLTISNNFTTMLWESMLPDIKIHKGLPIKTGGEIGWAMRSKSPKLKEVVDVFIKEHREGSLMSNILMKKYLKNTQYLKEANSPATLERFKELRGLFQKYGEQFNWDWLLLAAQGYQESQLDNTKKSPAGAVGIMQIKPSTAADPNVGVDNVYDMENNIHAATKYLNFLRSRYFDSPDIDPFNAMLLSLAAYNMGPGRMNQMRNKATEQGLNPNEWFGQVELIAAKEIGRETVQYVSNIYTYYASFRSLRKYGQNTGKAYVQEDN
ncbi:transglycosylase SLT domain-containing protein [Robiginitalea sp.]|uniref:transglycosylase SLT domain-containing protein n=1 Tax=Robiginitalea sp. TaxID=1902411 RepID=UPI003C758FD6